MKTYVINGINEDKNILIATLSDGSMAELDLATFNSKEKVHAELKRLNPPQRPEPNAEIAAMVGKKFDRSGKEAVA